MTKQELKARLKSLSEAVRSTLALLEAESVPAVSFSSLYESLHKSAEKCPDARTLKRAIEMLVRNTAVFSHHGQYSLERRAEAADERTHRLKCSAEKVRRVKFALTLFQVVPFIEALAVTGSVALGNAREHSDIDLFCIAKRGRVWTARAGALLLAELLGKRREGARAKLCFNYFAVHDADIPVKNVASAHMLALGMPVFGKRAWLHFLGRNRWISELLCFPYGVTHKTHSVHLPSEWSVLETIKRSLEKLLAGDVGDLVEKALKYWQVKRLSKKVASGGDPSHLFIPDDLIALHHPRPKNNEVMERYQKKMKELGLQV